jgi:hypothetical protein
MQYFDRLNQEIVHLKRQLVNHKVFELIQDENDLRIFMKYHVFAVWDFMSLLKSLQQNLTCVTTPWVPVGTAETRFLINEIVTGEESDVDMNGKRISHFELYLEAMQQCGADISQITHFIQLIKEGASPHNAMEYLKIPQEIQQFVNQTFSVVYSKRSFLQAAVFTFGREDLIPDMFTTMVREMYARVPQQLSIFKYYLERHIEVDGGHHSHLALEMTQHLIGDDAKLYDEAILTVIEALRARMMLWDGAYIEIANAREEA